MPNTLRVQQVLTQSIVGIQQFNGLWGKCVSMPDETYREVQDASRALLHLVAASIDWPRLLQGAAMRHDTVHPDEPADSDRPALSEGVCGECLHHALLEETGNEGSPLRWAEDPDVDLTGHQDVDWAEVVARGVSHRPESSEKDAMNTTSTYDAAGRTIRVGDRVGACISGRYQTHITGLVRAIGVDKVEIEVETTDSRYEVPAGSLKRIASYRTFLVASRPDGLPDSGKWTLVDQAAVDARVADTEPSMCVDPLIQALLARIEHLSDEA
ncbi:hypothetical protein [Streptomyces albidoflavus]|uniref:hypothetical protein n=1 Tax=Streptomyces albidoflavus TaxID=1886 RepID=UPI00101FADE4|nr:hypothetical protein [Streptomyces albidoflavus]RZF02943.1 hypothetical protein C0R05_32555 [Streptomyces albidoflavus]